MKKTVFLTLFLCYPIFLFSQYKNLEEYMHAIRYYGIDYQEGNRLLDNTNATETQNQLKWFRQDSITNVRMEMYRLLMRGANRDTNLLDQLKYVELISYGVCDFDSGITGYVHGLLKTFPLKSFSEKTQQDLLSLFRSSRAHLSDYMQLLAFLQIPEATSKIRSLLNNWEIRNKDLRWKARISLARLDDTTAINYINTVVMDLDMDTQIAYDLVPDLVFTRQKKIFDYLIKEINVNQRNCLAANPNIEKYIKCGYRIMEFTASAFHNFPYKLSVSGDLETDDYKTALKNVREWFKSFNWEADFNYDRF